MKHARKQKLEEAGGRSGGGGETPTVDLEEETLVVDLEEEASEADLEGGGGMKVKLGLEF